MSLSVTRKTPGFIVGSDDVLVTVSPGETLRLVDDRGELVLSVNVPNLDPEGYSSTGDDSSSRAFLHVARDVLVCDERGTTVPIAGRRLQLDH